MPKENVDVKVESKRYPITDDMVARLRRDYTYHAPKPDQISRYEIIRTGACALAEVLVTLCPPSRELSLALTNVEAAVAHANMAIARNEE